MPVAIRTRPRQWHFCVHTSVASVARVHTRIDVAKLRKNPHTTYKITNINKNPDKSGFIGGLSGVYRGLSGLIGTNWD